MNGTRADTHASLTQRASRYGGASAARTSASARSAARAAASTPSTRRSTISTSTRSSNARSQRAVVAALDAPMSAGP